MSTITSDAGALEDLATSVRALLSAKSPESRVREVMESPTGFDPDLWQQLAAQVGAHSLPFPEDVGGAGFGYVELGVVMRELGRRLVPGPFLSSIAMAGAALIASGDSAAHAEHVPGIADGSTIGTLAVIEADGAWRTDGFTTTARLVDGQWVLTGTKTIVLDAEVADLFVVAADTRYGTRLFVVRREATRLTTSALRPLDLTRHVGQVRLQDTPAVVLDSHRDGADVLEEVLDRAAVALAAEQVGAARACLEMSVAYARERIQFGRAIGSFQAVKHKCADMFSRLQVAEATATEAARAADGLEGAPDLGEAAAVAHAVCSEAAMFIAKETIQVHGGIGFTWEHPAHLYFRRAKASQLLLGGPAVYYERLLRRWGI